MRTVETPCVGEIEALAPLADTGWPLRVRADFDAGWTLARYEEVDGLTASAATFGLPGGQAAQIPGEVVAATKGWRQVATSNGIPERELTRMAEAQGPQTHPVRVHRHERK